MGKCLCYQGSVYCVQQLMMILLYVEKYPAPYEQVLLLPSQRLVRPVAEDDFIICRNANCGQVLVLQSQCLVCPAADDDFAIS